MILKNNKVVFSIILLLCMLLIGCESDENIKTEPFHEEKIANLDEIWHEYENGSYEIKAVVKNEKSAYILIETWGEDEQGQMIYQVEDNEITQIGNWQIEENIVTKTMDVDGAGDFYIIEEIRDGEIIHSNIKLIKYNDNSVQNFLLDSYVGENDVIKFIQWSSNRNLYLFLESGKIVVLLEDLKLVGDISEHEGEYFVDVARMQDGNVIFISAKYNGDNEILVMYEIENESQRKLLELPEGQYGSNILISGNNTYDYYIRGEYELLGGKKEISELIPIFRFQDIDIEPSEILFICSLIDGRLFAINKAENTDLIYIVKGHEQGEEKKEILNLASLDRDSQIEKEVAKFNKNNKKYRIEIKNYGEYEEPLQNFLIDLSTGAEFDLVEFPSNETDKMVAKEIFADLYPFIDSDAALNRDDFYENMLKAFEYEGKLYQSVSFVHLYGWVTKYARINNMEKWDVESIRRYMEQNSGVNIFTDTSGEDILKQMILISSRELIDWEHKSCNFDSDDFRNILILARDYGVGSSEIRDADKVSALLENRLLFVETPISIEDFCVYHKVLGDDMAVVASPYVKQNGANLYSTMTQIGIIANSKYQDGAWQFVRHFFTREYQDISDDASFQMTGYSGFPVRKDCMEDLIRRFTATEDYEKDGKWYTAIKPNDYSIGWDEFDIDIGPMSKEEEEMLRELLANAKQKQEIDPVIWNIVLEESRYFFSGEKTPEETTKIIQNRVMIYMNE